MGITFREEGLSDFEQIEKVIKEAFKATPVRSGSEYETVKKLRKEPTFNPKYARVAIVDNKIIGYIILSKVHITNESLKTPILNLAIVSVTPSEQRQGIGADLIRNALSIAKEEGEEAVIVLGHPTYYPKFGFKPASTWGINLPFEAPDESFFALQLVPDSLEGVSGVVEYTSAFFGQ